MKTKGFIRVTDEHTGRKRDFVEFALCMEAEPHVTSDAKQARKEGNTLTRNDLTASKNALPHVTSESASVTSDKPHVTSDETLAMTQASYPALEPVLEPKDITSKRKEHQPIKFSLEASKTQDVSEIPEMGVAPFWPEMLSDFEANKQIKAPLRNSLSRCPTYADGDELVIIVPTNYLQKLLELRTRPLIEKTMGPASKGHYKTLQIKLDQEVEQETTARATA